MGIVLPTAIDKHILFAVVPSRTNKFTIAASDINESVSFELDNLISGEGWVNYVMGVIHAIQEKMPTQGGVNCIFKSNIPKGAGLSSSAALCSGFGYALNELFDLRLSKLDLALIAQEAEHTFAGVNCGIMDPYSSLFSQRNHILSLDCRDNSHELIPFAFSDLEILLIDTQVKHSLATSAYNKRRSACEHGLSVLKREDRNIKSFRDVNVDQLDNVKEKLEYEIFEKCSYVIEEMNRVDLGLGFLKENNLSKFGSLMYEAHEGLRVKYDVSCPELDFLVGLAKTNGVTGARMMGGGFGGCTINLINKTRVSSFKESVREMYFTRFGASPLFYHVKPSDGVTLEPVKNFS